MDLRALRTEADYDWALSEVAAYFEREPVRGTPEAERFDVLSDLIAAYEARHWPIEAPDPVEAIRETMERHGFTQSDLAALLGSRSRASEVLRHRRPLSMDMAYRLSTEWKIPAEVLIRPYRIEPRS
ncbi:helix-turn-helix domain-containing protein [Antarcticirhabdus aurantiaca]|uniref:XRE family transcriptional regulator n=1 Tax=Antarcticirhabdus aurantiaca TaxID=2606717 RepID=A0ACD4NXN2_9HYPH|nr:XRE family transcriptional regulator [Antarcticirhabdus aurantiaca]WAJ31545.1 XRE family transcriptional regulator [Jeongeuplla avenae]